jgi:hypothetical protein
MTDPKNDTSPLSDLRERLYSREEPVQAPVIPEPHVVPSAPQTESWEAPTPPAKKKIAWSVLFLGGALLLFILAVSVAAFFLFFGTRAISSDRIAIQVAPITAQRSGDTATMLVTVTNNNPTTISATRLVVTFPDSARSGDDPSKPYPRFEDTLGDMAPGESKTQTIKVVLAGALGEVVSTPITFEYKTEGSAAVFVKEFPHEIIITSSPLEVVVTTPQQVAAGEEITINVSLRSTSPTSLEDLVVQGQYPFGFIPSKRDAVLFEVGTLAPGKEVSFSLTGTLTGEDTDERVFRFTAGTRGAAGVLGRTYASGQGSVALARSFLSTKLTVNNQRGQELFMQVGKASEARVSWTNTLAHELTDAQISVALSGEALDPASVFASGGFYRSVDTTVVYSKENNKSLARLAPGSVGNGTFSFSTKAAEYMKSMRSPVITAVVTVTGKSVGEGNKPQTLTSSFTHTILVGTEFGVAAQSSRSRGPFTNSGPIPPKANVESTYTILVDLTSTVNSVAGATVQASLPSYVRYLGVTSPADGSITYDASTRIVTWAAGTVAAGTSASAPKRAAFQVALLPSISQKGTSPALVSSITYSGEDGFTKQQLTGSVYDVTTQTTGDPGYLGSMGQVDR